MEGKMDSKVNGKGNTSQIFRDFMLEMIQIILENQCQKPPLDGMTLVTTTFRAFKSSNKDDTLR